MQNKSFSPIEFVAMFLLFMVMFAGVSGTLLLLAGGAGFVSSLFCFNPVLASVLGLVLIALRRRPATSAGSTTVLATLLLVLGFTWIGFGLFSVAPGSLEDSSLSVVENLGMATALCFAPGGLLSLLGLGAYWYEVKQGGETAVAAPATAAPAADLPETANSNVLMYQARLTRAGVYREKILELVRQNQSDAFHQQLSEVAAELERWEARVRELVQRLTAYETNNVIRHDLRAVPEAIANLERQLANETDAQLQQEIREALTSYRQQQAQLDELDHQMRRTQFDLEETVAAMGTIYSQMEILGAREIDSGRARRLSHDVSEQVQQLNDLLTAVDEVYNHTGYTIS